MAEPRIQFCTSADGTRIAYSTTRKGSRLTPVVVVQYWLVPLEMTRHAYFEGALTKTIGGDRLLVRHDRRGMGHSQRDVTDVSLDAQVADVAAIVDDIGLSTFDLVGFVDGCFVAAAYAARSPGRVRRLALGSAPGLGTTELYGAQARLIRADWRLGRRSLADLTLADDADSNARGWFVEQLGRLVHQDVAALYAEMLSRLEIPAGIQTIDAETIVVHPARQLGRSADTARELAAAIPGARLIMTEHGSFGREYGQPFRRFLDESDEPADEDSSAGAGRTHTILFTDLASSTALTQRLGDAKAQELVRAHNVIVREALASHGESEIKHTGDGIMASFPTASGALECAVAIQRAVGAREDADLQVHIGLNAGEPVAEESDLFGTSVQLARRICDHASSGQVLVSNVVRELAAGKGFLFADIGEVVPKGFEEPVRLYEVRWRD